MNWKKLPKYFWSVYGKTQKGLPKDGGHIEYKNIGSIIYLKINKDIYKSLLNSKNWKKVEDVLEIICLGD